MNPYNPEATCPKCGGKDIGTHYRATGIECRFDAAFHIGNAHETVDGEHLDRICRNCGYVWPEMCLDDPSITEEELAKFVKKWTVVPNTPRPLTETALSEFLREWRGDSEASTNAPDF